MLHHNSFRKPSLSKILDLKYLITEAAIEKT